jgi:hypothetical protein
MYEILIKLKEKFTIFEKLPKFLQKKCCTNCQNLQTNMCDFTSQTGVAKAALLQIEQASAW